MSKHIFIGYKISSGKQPTGDMHLKTWPEASNLNKYVFKGDE